MTFRNSLRKSSKGGKQQQQQKQQQQKQQQQKGDPVIIHGGMGAAEYSQGVYGGLGQQQPNLAEGNLIAARPPSCSSGGSGLGQLNPATLQVDAPPAKTVGGTDVGVPLVLLAANELYKRRRSSRPSRSRRSRSRKQRRSRFRR